MWFFRGLYSIACLDKCVDPFAWNRRTIEAMQLLIISSRKGKERGNHRRRVSSGVLVNRPLTESNRLALRLKQPPITCWADREIRAERRFEILEYPDRYGQTDSVRQYQRVPFLQMSLIVQFTFSTHFLRMATVYFLPSSVIWVSTSF